jgi:hypothetical protein
VPSTAVNASPVSPEKFLILLIQDLLLLEDNDVDGENDDDCYDHYSRANTDKVGLSGESSDLHSESADLVYLLQIIVGIVP